jgi:hypothetical protein
LLSRAAIPFEGFEKTAKFAGVSVKGRNLPLYPAPRAGFVPFFDPRLGRPSTSMEVYLRLMFLKFRYRLGYESLCREVGDSITWRRFCRIPIDGQVPHPTTLMKLTTRCGWAGVLGRAVVTEVTDGMLIFGEQHLHRCGGRA